MWSFKEKVLGGKMWKNRYDKVYDKVKELTRINKAATTHAIKDKDGNIIRTETYNK